MRCRGNVVVLNLGALGGGRVAAANLHAGGAGVGLCVCILDELEVGAPDAGRLIVQGDGLVAGEAVVLGKPVRDRDAAGEDALVLCVGVDAVSRETTSTYSWCGFAEFTARVGIFS